MSLDVTPKIYLNLPRW